MRDFFLDLTQLVAVAAFVVGMALVFSALA